MKAVSIFILFFSLCTLIVSCGHKAKTTVVKENWVAKDTTIEKRVAFIKKIIAVPYDSVYVANYRPDKLVDYKKKKDWLKQPEIDDVLSILKNQGAYWDSYANCFDPHLYFYFIKHGDTTASVEVCFECSMIWEKINHPREELYMKMSHKTMVAFNKYSKKYALGFLMNRQADIDVYKDSVDEAEGKKQHFNELEKLKGEHEVHIRDSLMKDSIMYARKPWWKKIFKQ